MFNAVLIANRGEIAVRVMRACRELGVRSIAVHSEADADAMHVRVADEAHLLGPTPPAESYLHIERILDVAARSGADAIHPGYGFLSENADFARAVVEAGLGWIGPPPEAIESMGDKLTARAVATAAAVPVVPGTTEPTADPDIVRAFGEAHGWPVAVKAAYGGGGRGLKVVSGPDQVEAALAGARREAEASFGRGECYVERYLANPRHVEVQVLADTDGTTLHLGERDCSLQRRHQKLVEEAPAPGLAPETRDDLRAAAIRVAKEMGYVGAGTCEFLVERRPDGTQAHYFLEMNTRLQVEHPVTELVTGVDLVHEQLRVAAGEGLSVTQDDITLTGHAIEVRLNAEDPAQNFMPAPGPVTRLRLPSGPGVRFDGGVETGDVIGQAYDSMVGKLIVWAADRPTAVARMARALEETEVVGIPTTLPFHRLAMAHEDFRAAAHSTASVEREWDLSALEPYAHDDTADGPVTVEAEAVLASLVPRTTTVREVALTVSGAPVHVAVHGVGRAGTAVRAAASRRREGGTGRGGGSSADGPELRAPMTGVIVTWSVEEGATVAAGDLVCVLEAMKMENHVLAHRDGVVGSLAVGDGDPVEQGSVLTTITAPDA